MLAVLSVRMATFLLMGTPSKNTNAILPFSV
jgi:hypothetical protein